MLLKYLYLFEEYIMKYPIILNNFKILEDIPLMLDLPQVKSKTLSFKIIDDKIVSAEITPYVRYDFIITNECEFLIGSQHYKMSNKAKFIKTCGELEIDESGKIVYLNNESGHYKPTKPLLAKTFEIFKTENLTSDDITVNYLY